MSQRYCVFQKRKLESPLRFLNIQPGAGGKSLMEVRVTTSWAHPHLWIKENTGPGGRSLVLAALWLLPLRPKQNHTLDKNSLIYKFKGLAIKVLSNFKALTSYNFTFHAPISGRIKNQKRITSTPSGGEHCKSGKSLDIHRLGKDETNEYP